MNEWVTVDRSASKSSAQDNATKQTQSQCCSSVADSAGSRNSAAVFEVTGWLAQGKKRDNWNEGVHTMTTDGGRGVLGWGRELGPLATPTLVEIWL